MAKNNQKREKALRNRENARKFRKKSPIGGNRRRGEGRPAGGFSSPSAPSSAFGASSASSTPAQQNV